MSNEFIVVGGSKIHKNGVFAKKDIPKGTKIIEYVGEKITKAEADKRINKQYEKAEKNGDGSVYIFELNKKYDIDGNVDYNPAKFINHSCSPNSETEIIRGHIWIIAIKDIKKGEEITFDYGFNTEGYEDFPCKCGSENCVGYIVSQEEWSKLKKKLGKR